MFKGGPVVWDSDNVPVPTIAFPFGSQNYGSVVKSNTFYHETYIATDDSKPLTAIIGANYFHENALEEAQTSANIPPLFYGYIHREGKVSAWSAFVDFGWNFTSELKFVGGVRYSDEKKDYMTVNVVPAGAPLANSATFTNTSPRIGLEYRPATNLLLYATATSGFKSGGFNKNFANNPFNPEKIWSYEAGFKSSPLGGRARLNASAFYYDYKDIQVSQAVLFNGSFVSRVTNGGTAKLWGADIDGNIRATDKLNADASLLHSEFGSSLFCDPLRGSCTAPVALQPLFNVKGNRLTRAPAVTANLSFDYDLNVGLPGKLSIRGDGSYRSKTYYTVFQNPIYAAPSFWLFGASVRYEDPKGWYGEIYGENLTDKLAITNLIASAPQRNAATGEFIRGAPACFCRYSPPRTYGARLGWKF
jgi:iron complex outermembrane recepter protein